ncbi:extracellular solute-binding protein [Cellulomonas sp. APG4]|uniref:ABC transporter substrate-binding protein n=1 Tax=Cellulomonas sp. APG4 TaxID=1538656 RepID=UPI00137B45B5|nr:extracellular solute-binding protein [Cellulomonas sp. APG4]NCT91260.1 extracellular solute-binding protein [Cellulomonas sp. APG4]
MFSTRKRLAAGATAGVLALGLVACGSGDGEGGAVDGPDAEELDGKDVGAMDDFGVGDTFVATEPVSIELLYRDHPNYPLDEDWLFFQEVEERNNVTFDITTAPLSDWDQRKGVLIGAGDAPDVISVTYPGQEAQFVASGAILPISDYVELMPHFQDKVEKWDLAAELDTLRQEDGKYYMLPGLYEALRYDYTIGLRTDLMEQAGVEEPRTWEDLADVLAAIKEDQGTQYAWSDRWKGDALLNVAAPSFGTVAGWGYGDGMTYDEEAGEYVYAGATDEYKALVEYFAGLVADGLLDPESFTQEDDQAVAKLINEQSFAMTTNSQEILSHRTSMAENLGEGTFELNKIRVPEGPAGDVMGGMRIENGFMISSDAAEKENFVATLQFLDWLFYSDEGLEFARWGIEGETFERDADGNRTLLPEITFLHQNPEGTTHLQSDLGFFNGVFSLAHGSTTDLVMTHITDEEKAWMESMASKEQAPLDPPAPLDEIEREQASLYQTALADYTKQNTLAFITGQRDLSEWDAYVSELEGQNMQAFVDIMNTAADRYQENNA